MNFSPSPFHAVAIGLLLTASFSLQRATIAQDTEPSQNSRRWEQLQQSDSRIRACRASWDVVFLSPAQPKANADIEKQVQRAMEQSKQQGGSESDVRDMGDTTRRMLNDSQKSSVQRSRLEFFRVGQDIRCNINYLDAKTQGIEFYDGTNSVYIETVVNGVKYSPQGYLRRDNKEILAHSAPSWQMIRFLTGIPFDQKVSSYNPVLNRENSEMIENEGSLILRRKTIPANGVGIEFPALMTVTFDRGKLRPTAYECANLLYDDPQQGKMGRVDISDYRSYQSGIWFPSKVTVKTPAFEARYTLIDVKFNDAVDPANLKLPANALLADSRFGLGDKTVVYKPKGGEVPSDDAIQKMLGLESDKATHKDIEEKQLASAKVKTRDSTTAAIPLLGLLCIGCGVLLWTRGKTER